jgi:hypothetical protein
MGDPGVEALADLDGRFFGTRSLEVSLSAYGRNGASSGVFVEWRYGFQESMGLGISGTRAPRGRFIARLGLLGCGIVI